MKKKIELYRCSICPAVSDESICTEINHISHDPFHPDPNDAKQWVCTECAYIIGLTLSELYAGDDDALWNFPF